jgi:lipid-binding SYLF domain-containing protein
MTGQRILSVAGILAAGVMMGACASTPNPGGSEDRALLHSRVDAAIRDFKTQDPTIQTFFDTAEAYAVFPAIISGAIVFGGAHGDGEVYQKGKFIGYADVSQASVGAQLGGQKYGEMIFFQNEGSLVDFKFGTMEFDARATAIAASKGAAAAADYRRGVIIFTLPESGLMAQAAVGGQKFRFEPAEETVK